MSCGQQAAGAPAIDWVERAALGASFLCLIHCAGLPLLLAALPALSRLIAIPEDFHAWILGLALLSAGALLLLGGPYETPVTTAGSVLLVLAHVANWRLRHRRHRHG